jgi:hypothetical protein
VAESGSLENCCLGNWTVGSNPTLSATFHKYFNNLPPISTAFIHLCRGLRVRPFEATWLHKSSDAYGTVVGVITIRE